MVRVEEELMPGEGDEDNRVVEEDQLLPVFDPQKESFLWWTNALRLDKQVSMPKKK